MVLSSPPSNDFDCDCDFDWLRNLNAAFPTTPPTATSLTVSSQTLNDDCGAGTGDDGYDGDDDCGAGAGDDRYDGDDDGGGDGGTSVPVALPPP